MAIRIAIITGDSLTFASGSSIGDIRLALSVGEFQGVLQTGSPEGEGIVVTQSTGPLADGDYYLVPSLSSWKAYFEAQRASAEAERAQYISESAKISLSSRKRKVDVMNAANASLFEGKLTSKIVRGISFNAPVDEYDNVLQGDESRGNIA